MNDINDKARLRREARARRWAASQADASIPKKLRDNFIGAEAEMGIVLPANGLTVAGYWPMGSEIDPRQLMQHLCEQGARCVLPVVVQQNAPLAFRVWKPGEPLVEGILGTRHPGEDAETAEPDVVLTPLVAFDEQGYRLGQGAGYYDRTLELLRQHRTITAIGLAYSTQIVADLPHAPHDQPLDWIITEVGALRCR